MLKDEAEYRYCILPSGNKDEFPDLDAELARRGISWSYLEFSPGGRIYRIPVAELSKLPWDAEFQEHYLGDLNSGHALHTMTKESLLRFNQGRQPIEWKPGKKELIQP